MGYVIGTDEAGYGPNLGPLVITATVWQAPGDPRSLDLYEILAPAVTPKPPNKTASGEALLIADSKIVYRQGKNLALLERAVFASLGQLNCRPGTWRELLKTLAPQALAHLADIPWYADFDCRVPLDALPSDVDQAESRLASALASAAVRLSAIRSRVIFPSEFNRSVIQQGTKGTVLSQATLELVSDVLANLESEPVWILCDKHGGRNRYGPLLQTQFPEPLIEVRQESRPRSIYRWKRNGQPVEAHFCARGESHLPVALSSMVSKYLRETAMRAFNQFWQRHVKGVRSTAGYPTDAKRFKGEIAAVQKELDVSDAVLWRER